MTNNKWTANTFNGKPYETVTYRDLTEGDIIIWYGALLRVTEIIKEDRTVRGLTVPCTYFKTEAYEQRSIEILGSFYCTGCYGGLDSLPVSRLIKEE